MAVKPTMSAKPTVIASSPALVDQLLERLQGLDVCVGEGALAFGDIREAVASPVPASDVEVEAHLVDELGLRVALVARDQDAIDGEQLHRLLPLRLGGADVV